MTRLDGPFLWSQDENKPSAWIMMAATLRLHVLKLRVAQKRAGPFQQCLPASFMRDDSCGISQVCGRGRLNKIGQFHHPDST
jgi:hypothetical protein